MTQLPYCPVCDRLIMRPVWLPDQFVAWCHVCERGYTEAEIVWRDERNDAAELQAIAETEAAYGPVSTIESEDRS